MSRIMAGTGGGRPARARRWPAGLAWALWALAMLSLGVIWWLDHLLRQMGRADRPRWAPRSSPRCWRR
jgi:hypothetical protein